MPKTSFEKYFTLDEAVALLPKIEKQLVTAVEELSVVKDKIILLKRLLKMRDNELDQEPSEDELEQLKQYYERFEEVYSKWISHFNDQGIILRDLEQGLLDFPYRSQTQNRDFFLCWHAGEEGLFYFHPTDVGFNGRQPISLLPD